MPEFTLVPYEPEDAEALVEFLSGNEWPFHSGGRPPPERVRESIAGGTFMSEDACTFWIVSGEGERVGMIRLHDLGDETPVFDIRIAERHRGKGAGTAAVRAITEHAFTTMGHVTRIEAHTRVDNVAMRSVLRRCGYAKEAHHRRAWPVEGGEPRDTVGYGILREDWLEGTVTPVRWNDEASPEL